MKSFILTIIASVIGQAIVFILYQGFIKSYWGKNSIEEVSRAFNKMCKHWRKENV